jgi:hypothetical protein
MVTCQKNLGSVGIIFFFFTIDKTGNSRSCFLNLIPVFHFQNFRYAVICFEAVDELRSFSTFFALNFDKKLEIFFFEIALPKWAEIWWEALMEGSVLSFLKAEWKVSDTDSSQCWASSYV